MLKLLIHAPTPEALARARNNAANFLKAAPAGAEVEIVVNAGAVAAALQTAHATDEYLRICRNTLHAQGLELGGTLQQSQVVAAAVLHLAERQAAGWAYVRA